MRARKGGRIKRMNREGDKEREKGKGEEKVAEVRVERRRRCIEGGM